MRRDDGERGSSLPLTVVLLATGTLAIMPLLTYASTLFNVNRNESDHLVQRVVAESAINRVIADLRRGADGIPTTYQADQPHTQGQPYQTFQFPTSYAPVGVSLNGYVVTATISLPTVATPPSGQQQYFDPGTTNPDLARVPAGTGFLMRVFNVASGNLQVNWAYAPARPSRIGAWQGVPVDPLTGQPYPPGLINSFPSDPTILDTGDTGISSNNNLTGPVAVAPGIVSILFYNSDNVQKRTVAYAPSGSQGDTWLYGIAYRDYVIAATVQSQTVTAYVRQNPGYTQPPSGGWSAANTSWVDNKVYVYSWIY